MRRLAPLLPALALTVVLAAPSQARLVDPGYGRSWGKAGVPLDQYRADAVECGHRAAAVDLAGSDPAKALALATRIVENNPNAAALTLPDGTGASVDVMGAAGAAPGALQAIDPARQIAKAGDLIEAALEQCLSRRGYSKFKLTCAQRKRLAKLAPGSDQRHAYLHSLASDPEVLARQKAE
jgi:hypothetical protein